MPVPATWAKPGFSASATLRLIAPEISFSPVPTVHGRPEGQPRGILNPNERDAVDLVVGAMPVLAVEHRHPVANEAFTGAKT